MPDPIFGDGVGPTPEFSTLLSLKGCQSQVSVMVDKDATETQLAVAAATVLLAVTQQQQVCEAQQP